MNLIPAFFNAVKSAANSVKTVAETVAKTVAETATKVLQTIAKVASKVAITALQLAMILAVGTATMLILPIILPMILPMSTDIEQEEHSQVIELLPPSKRPIKQVELIENEVLITPPSDEDLLIYSFFQEPLEQPTTEIQEAAETEKTPTTRDIKPLNNRLALTTICWQTLSNVSEKLSKIKASELKSIASELQIPKYRSLNKSQLLVEIMQAI